MFPSSSTPDHFILIPGTTRFFNRSDLNSLIVRGTLNGITQLVIPSDSSGRFHLKKSYVLNIEAVVNVLSHKVRPQTVEEGVTKTEDDEDIQYYEEFTIKYGRIELQGTTVNLLQSVEYAALSQKESLFVDSKIDFYLRGLKSAEEYQKILRLVQAELEETTNSALEIRDVDEEPSNHKRNAEKLKEKLDLDAPKQPERLQSISKRFEQNTVLQTSDNVFALTDSLFESKRITVENLSEFNNQIRAILNEISISINTGNIQEYYSAHEPVNTDPDDHYENNQNLESDSLDNLSRSIDSPDTELLEAVEEE